MDYSASYLQLSRTEFEARIGETEEQLRSCHLCPRECGADRASEKGFCQAGSTLVVSSFGPHMGEESVLAGRTGSGTIFFGHCNLRCVYCQNYQLSILGSGSPVTSEQLASMMLIIQDRYKCPNINLVTPTHYVPQILQAVYTAAQRGLLVRHLVLPGGLEDTKKVLDFIAGELSPDCMVNLMDQYYPCYQADRFSELKRRLSAREYDQARQYAQGLGLRLYN